jgi:hypothetical protein
LDQLFELPGAGTTGDGLIEAVSLIVVMLAGGLLGLFVRWLYRRYAATVSDRDAFSRTFPLLMLATVLVIFVIKSSLALSLGLVGALSIVRFRAAIKEPEEIVYLFFCIATGIALGAKYFWFALAGVLVFSSFVIAMHLRRRGGGLQPVVLTISGRQSELCDGDLDRFTSVVADTVKQLTVQRLNVEDGEVQYRVAVQPQTAEIGKLIADLQQRLPQSRLSYVNLQGLL